MSVVKWIFEFPCGSCRWCATSSSSSSSADVVEADAAETLANRAHRRDEEWRGDGERLAVAAVAADHVVVGIGVDVDDAVAADISGRVSKDAHGRRDKLRLMILQKQRRLLFVHGCIATSGGERRRAIMLKEMLLLLLLLRDAD